jgi:tol-pal system protein YbgF
MTIHITTTRAVLALTLALIYVALTPATPAAADREHQQIMADLRMLQEQTQQLQALMNDLGEALKAVNSRIEDQTSLERKAFADGKVQMDTMSGDLRIVREKVDETNVRLGTITQELESIRDAIPQPGAPMVPSLIDPSTGVPTTADPTAGPTPSATPPPGLQPQRLWQSSYGDYMTGNYVLAVEGFESYIRYFPKSPQAPEAQLYIGEALFLDKKYAEAVAAYDRVVANYAGTSSVPTAYYKRGLSLEQLKETDRARESYETVIKQFADSHQAQLARQALERMSRPGR